MTRPLDQFGLQKPAFFYFFDALCGWCYGFSPVVLSLYEKYKEQIEFEVVSGGMITNERVGPVGEVAPYIKQAYRTVEERTGAQFGTAFLEGILEEGKAVFTSVPPAVAMAVLKHKAPQQQVPFAALLQRAVYSDGIRPAISTDYVPYAVEAGLDGEDFLEAMNQLQYRKAAQDEFRLAAQIGVRGFPTCIMKRGNEYFLLANGYLPFLQLEKGVQQVLSGKAGAPVQ